MSVSFGVYVSGGISVSVRVTVGVRIRGRVRIRVRITFNGVLGTRQIHEIKLVRHVHTRG